MPTAINILHAPAPKISISKRIIRPKERTFFSKHTGENPIFLSQLLLILRQFEYNTAFVREDPLIHVTRRLQDKDGDRVEE